MMQGMGGYVPWNPRYIKGNAHLVPVLYFPLLNQKLFHILVHILLNPKSSDHIYARWDLWVDQISRRKKTVHEKVEKSRKGGNSS